MKNIILLSIIKGYQKGISPLFPPSCRYYPTCSHYAVDAIEKHGAAKGSLMGAARIMRCHPLPLVIIGEHAEVDVKSAEKETQPPKAFTEGTLLTAMKTANKTVDDEEAIKILQEVEGIGTEATRANIIEALKQKEYIQVIKNKLVVTEKGKLLCQAVESQHLLTSAEMTAKWETYLKKIGKREGNQENFITNIKKFIVHLLEAVPNDIEKLNFSDYQEQKEKEAEKSIVGKCPKCGNNIVSLIVKLS